MKQQHTTLIRRIALATSKPCGLRFGLGIVLALGLTFAVEFAHADFSVDSVKASIKNEQVVVDLDMDLTLSDDAEEAIQRGIPLIIAIEIELAKSRPLIWDSPVTKWKRDIEISYHALSEHYLVQETGRSEIQNFLNLSEVMSAISNQRLLKIPVPKLPTNAELNYILKVRARLDAEALPTPLRLMAYLSPNWRLSTGWSKWPVEH